MQQIKIFSGKEAATADLEQEINQWLQEHNVRVIQMVGNIAPQSPMLGPSGETTPLPGVGAQKRTHPPSDILVMILYEA